MKRIIGFALFFLGLGMMVMLILGNAFVGVLLIAACLLAGYYLFCC